MYKGLCVSLVLLAVMAVSGCSSTESDTSGADGPLSGEAAAGLARAEAGTEENLQEPTTIPLTEPLNSKPPTGKTFIYMKCQTPTCQEQADAIEDASEALGWTFKDIPFRVEDPGTLVAGMRQALQSKPDVVGVASLPEPSWRSVIPEYREAGVAIVANFVGEMEYDDTVIGQAGAGANAEWGEMVANWAIADSNGKANVLLQTVNDYAIVKEFSESYQATMKENCPGCSVTVLNNTIAQASSGEIVGTIVAALQKDPSISYVATGFGPFVSGLVPALSAAGMSDRVKISGESADPTNLANVKAGKESAFTAYAATYTAWLMVDIYLRHLQGMEFNPAGNGGLPTQLLTKDVDFEVAPTYNKPADWKAQMLELWHLS